MRPTPSARRQNKTHTRIGRILLALILVISGTFVIGRFALSDTTEPTPGITVTWPTADALLSGTQTLTATLGTTPTSRYEMYWRVDEGRWTRMQNSPEGALQKTSVVDVTSWATSGPGPYALEFIAKRHSGKIITRTTVRVTIDTSAMPSGVLQPTETQVWWPLDNTVMTGTYTFKAVVKQRPLDDYTMSWQVDSGLPVPMVDSYDGTPHKEARVNVAGWTWSPDGEYNITFVAKDTSGTELGRITRRVKVGDGQAEPAPTPLPAPEPTPTPTTSDAATETFSLSRTIEETGSMGSSSSASWWVNSGGRMIESNGTGKTIQGDLVSSDRWFQAYASANALDTDGGKHPQNIFRFVRRGSWNNFTQEAYFKITKNNFSASPNRAEHNGLLLFNRYVDGNNLYYTGLRVDGAAVIKKKKSGTYSTLAYKPFIAGTYNRETNPNLLPLNTWIGLRSVVSTTADGSTAIRFYIDKGRTGSWVLAAEATDTSPITAAANAGIRTDFMDVEFDDYHIE